MKLQRLDYFRYSSYEGGFTYFSMLLNFLLSIYSLLLTFSTLSVFTQMLDLVLRRLGRIQIVEPSCLILSTYLISVERYSLAEKKTSPDITKHLHYNKRHYSHRHTQFLTYPSYSHNLQRPKPLIAQPFKNKPERPPPPLAHPRLKKSHSQGEFYNQNKTGFLCIAEHTHTSPSPPFVTQKGRVRCLPPLLVPLLGGQSCVSHCL